MISRWNYDSSPQERSDHTRLAARVRRQAPELVAEWLSFSNSEEKARRHLVRQGVSVPADAGVMAVGPLTISQLFAHKAVLALYFEHFRRPLTDAGRVYASWRSKEDFLRDGIPKIFFELLPSYATLTQGRWSESETFEYRHASSNTEGGLFGCFARFRRGLFVFGFAAADASVLPPYEVDWIKPSDLLSLLNSSRFQKKD
jgi:hypothetical protein